MEVVSWVVFGGLVGALARLIVPGRQAIGVLWTVGIGIASSIVGGVLGARVLEIGDDDRFDFGSFIGAVIVATFLVAVAARLLPDARRKDRKETE
jgi:uncharacterized membrane protein YeaQ/YmgE (transglycosylase-associated protein family)